MRPGRRLRDRLQHILDAIETIEDYTAGRGLSDYLAERQLRDAIERNFERLSEASRHLPAAFKARHPEVPWHQIAALGNVLRHEYDAIEDHVIWDTAITKLLPLRSAVEAMLREVLADEREDPSIG
jgi:uncharacterized protein with HEPN domain